MARAKRDSTVDLSIPHELTPDLIDALACPPGKSQAFLRDTKSPGLRVRVTAGGAKSYVFEGKLDRRTIRRTIGDVRAWLLPEARKRANAERVLLDSRTDPRELERQVDAAKLAAAQAEEAAKAADAARAITVADAWAVYMVHGKPKKRDAWKPRYIADLHKAAAPGGEPKGRGQGKTKPGHLWPLMGKRLSEIDADTVRDWYAEERKRAPVQAARAVAIFSGFLGWCATRKEYRDLVDRDCARAAQLADMLPGIKRRTDAVEEAQLAAWFTGTNKLERTARAYLQSLILTGARREEMAGLRWANVDFTWKKLTIADKVSDTRTIPLAPYLAQLLGGLPRVKDAAGEESPFVFASAGTKSGYIAEPRSPHERVLSDAGIPHVSIHGLRRTFALMGEAAGAPAGAIAQIMGHRPSAVAEGYKPRSIDALRPYMARIEAFILDRAGLVQPEEGAARVRVVGGTGA